jgi:hypothetical protein
MRLNFVPQAPRISVSDARLRRFANLILSLNT